MNDHNGVFCSSLSEGEILVDLQPQSVKLNDKPLAPETLHVTVGTSFGTFEIVLSLSDDKIKPELSLHL